MLESEFQECCLSFEGCGCVASPGELFLIPPAVSGGRDQISRRSVGSPALGANRLYAGLAWRSPRSVVVPQLPPRDWKPNFAINAVALHSCEPEPMNIWPICG